MISDLTPNGTDETPALSMFLMLMIIFINLAILVTVFARRLKVSERSVRPGEITRKIWIDWIGFLMLVRTSKKYARWQERVKENRPPSRENQVDMVADESTVNASKYETDGSLDKQEPKQEVTLQDMEWELIAFVVDRFCMTLYFIAIFGFIIWFITINGAQTEDVQTHLNMIYECNSGKDYIFPSVFPDDTCDQYIL